MGNLIIGENIAMVKKYYEFKKEDIENGKYSAWKLIEPLWWDISIYDGIDKYNEDMKPFTDAQRKVFALFWYDSEVCNGGHDQFLFNSTGIVWKDALEGFKMIGADEYAANFQKLIDILGGSIPYDRKERNELMDKFYEKNDDEENDILGDIDDFYYELDLEEVLDEYVKKHASEFVINGIWAEVDERCIED